ncbi:WSSV520 [White spot syndrome virus]|uniref:WSSV520 n=1 Tax=White spot syndrome virus TaxID=342409 RepID=A0A2I6SCH7_9VIRU|nr:WSSV520 [White spot syndrome virus]
MCGILSRHKGFTKTVLHVTHFILCLEREIERHFGSFYNIGESRCIVEGKFMR